MRAFEGPRATPTVEGDLLVAVGQWGEMACLDIAEGKEMWRKDYTKDFGGKPPAMGLRRISAHRRRKGGRDTRWEGRLDSGAEQEDRAPLSGAARISVMRRITRR